MSKGLILWRLWAGLSVALAALLYVKMSTDGQDKSMFLPGETSYGHYQIEMVCNACHAGSYTDADAMQQACMDCHGEELERVEDSHPRSKFTDPRNADRIKKLDGRYCVTCHVEHRPEITLSMGLTVAGDICFHCHSNIAEDRPTHNDLEFEGCASAGCHNFHDNRALYEDFLLKHADDGSLLAAAVLPGRNLIAIVKTLDSYPVDEYPITGLNVKQADAPADKQAHPEEMGTVTANWSLSAHANAGVNCSACHVSTPGNWANKPDQSVCKSCHADEVKGFVGGRHGMRLAQGLSPMRPEMAHAKMSEQSHGKELGCSSCHAPHDYDTRYAAVEACLSCHADEHSLAYKHSKHYELWLTERESDAPPGSGVSCSTCHMPRLEMTRGSISDAVLVNHNQNDTLRPNEKMIRPVCMQCHGLSFSIDALADRSLVENNFSGQPAVHIRSVEMALENQFRDQNRRN
jgi:hypothetical protein